MLTDSQKPGATKCQTPSVTGTLCADVTWIGGWGVDPERLRPLARQLPQARHKFLAPVVGSVELAIESDYVIAWSLGAWRVLEAAAQGTVFRGQIFLLAPFIGFCSDYGLGGRCSLTQVRWLRRWLQREPAAALADFHRRAGLQAPPDHLPYPLADLLEGLDRLAEDAPATLRAFVANGLPPRWWAVIGAADPLLDANTIHRILPGSRILPGLGHDVESLFLAFREPLVHSDVAQASSPAGTGGVSPQVLQPPLTRYRARTSDAF